MLRLLALCALALAEAPKRRRKLRAPRAAPEEQPAPRFVNIYEEELQRREQAAELGPPLPLHGLGSLAQPVRRSRPGAVLGEDSFLVLAPRDGAAQSALAGGIAPEQTPSSRMGTWLEAHAAEEAPPLGLNLTLVRRDAAAPGVWSPLPCVNSETAYLQRRVFATNRQFNVPFQPRGPKRNRAGPVQANARCVRSCGAGVFDDAFTQETLLRSMEHIAPVLFSRGPNVDAAKKITAKEAYSPEHNSPEANVVALLVQPVISLLASSLDLDESLLELSVARVDFGLLSDAEARGECELHSDFHSSHGECATVRHHVVLSSDADS